MHQRHVAHADDRAIDGFDGQVVEFIEHGGTAVERDIELGDTDLGGAAGKDEVLGVQRVDHVG